LNSLQLVGVAALVLAGASASPAVVRVRQIPAIAQAESETVLEGNLELIIEDSDQGSRRQYFLISGDRRVPLRFTSSPPANLTTGTRVRVRGRWEADGTLVVITIETL
jgi:hypothetical protein